MNAHSNLHPGPREKVSTRQEITFHKDEGKLGGGRQVVKNVLPSWNDDALAFERGGLASPRHSAAPEILVYELITLQQHT